MTRTETRNLDSLDPLALIFRARLHEAQEAAEMKNEDLARRLDVSLRLVQKWRSGVTRPGNRNLIKLAAVLGHEPGWFFTDNQNGIAA